ncbi:homeobox protein onecut-like [Oratosquilla oratoria]|uniref:homeobox protein onecut-like n=1 Tax=Oratosquilla oratoria TaxID=337810 RepID=UPI003F763786
MNANPQQNVGRSFTGTYQAGQLPDCRFTACKRKEEQQSPPEQPPAPKKPRLVFTDLQRRTLQAIFKETKRPSKEMQVTIARQLGLEPSTVGNFFMNARRRSMDKWKDDTEISNKTVTSTQGATTLVHVSQVPQMQQQTNTMMSHSLDDHDTL